MIRHISLIVVFTTLLLSSCGVTKFVGYYASSGEPDQGNLNGEVFTSEDTSYRIGSLPEGWERKKIDGGDMVFTNAGYGASITVNSTCDANKTKYSLKALSESLLIGIKSKKAENREVIIVDGQEALKSIYSGTYNGVPIKITSVVFKKGDCVYDFTYVSSPDSFEQGMSDFDNFIAAFRVI